MEDVVASSVGQQRLVSAMAGVFAVLAALLAMVGVFGVMTYNVRRQRREIGIRLALGAETRRVQNMVVFQGMRITAVGIGAGLIAAWGLAQVLAGFLFGVEARDPLVFVTVPIALGLVALAAVWIPARRASRVDPQVALRYE